MYWKLTLGPVDPKGKEMKGIFRVEQVEDKEIDKTLPEGLIKPTAGPNSELMYTVLIKEENLTEPDRGAIPYFDGHMMKYHFFTDLVRPYQKASEMSGLWGKQGLGGGILSPGNLSNTSPKDGEAAPDPTNQAGKQPTTPKP